MRPRKVELEWVDSSAHPGPWVSAEDIDCTNLSCWSVGFLVAEDAGSVTIAQSYTLSKKGEPMQWGQAMTIPRCAVVKGLDAPKKKVKR